MISIIKGETTKERLYRKVAAYVEQKGYLNPLPDGYKAKWEIKIPIDISLEGQNPTFPKDYGTTIEEAKKNMILYIISRQYLLDQITEE